MLERSEMMGNQPVLAWSLLLFACACGSNGQSAGGGGASGSGALASAGKAGAISAGGGPAGGAQNALG
ncbi:MAG TPA: hypothetical protein VJV79_34915, partial [Polyangiaceae bacterium]|nr:hypothetical protein [Polyangiaceae bacterium]